MEPHPVPLEQQPLHEYEQLQASGFFRWATLSLGAYLKGISGVWLGAWVLTGPLAAASFAPQRFPAHFALAAGGGASMLLLLVMARLYLGWAYIRDRLFTEAVVYEESGWYDGDLWVKTPEELAKDRLLVQYQVQPVLQRLRRTLLTLVVVAAVGGLAWPLV